MDQARLRTLVDRYAPVLRLSGVTELYLFGSRARGDHRPDSDVDLFIDYDPGRQVPSYFRLIEIEQKLSEESGISVTITTRQSLHPLMRQAVESEAIRLM